MKPVLYAFAIVVTFSAVMHGALDVNWLFKLGGNTFSFILGGGGVGDANQQQNPNAGYQLPGNSNPTYNGPAYNNQPGVNPNVNPYGLGGGARYYR
jgi:hypothetical protein